MTEVKLGRIARARFGFGGYDDAMLGLSIAIEGKGWGVGDFKGTWDGERPEHAKWTEADRARVLSETCLFLGDLLRKAGVKSVADLVGTPVEVTVEGNVLRSWRVLEEVLP